MSIVVNTQAKTYRAGLDDVFDRVVEQADTFVAFGRPTKRKVVEMSRSGTAYYHKHNLVPWDEEFYQALHEHFGMEGNSILVNVYEKKQGIGFHTDGTKQLQPNTKVYSMSYSREVGQDYGLGKMEFRLREGHSRTFPIRPWEVFSWCPFQHAERGIKHKATSTFSRINITMRTTK